MNEDAPNPARPVSYGWDIGGAHLKFARLDDYGRVTDVRQIACPLWRGVEHLRDAFDAAWPRGSDPAAVHGVSMTGELCDNFLSRADGVTQILATVRAVLGNTSTRIYAGKAGWLAPDRVDNAHAGLVASANWLALAQVAAVHSADAIVIDIGSTTTDIIPIIAGVVASRGYTDAARLEHEELVYTGVVRTPLMAVCATVPIAGTRQRIAAEYFANMADVYRVLRELPDGADLYDTADGADKSVVASARRICRMLGRDLDGDPVAVESVARYFAYRQFNTLQNAMSRVRSAMPSRCNTIVAAGVGRYLAARLASFNAMDCIDFATLFEYSGASPQMVATAAPAVALARLRQSA